MRINAINIHYRLRVLSGISACYGAATSQILAIYENFPEVMSGSLRK